MNGTPSKEKLYWALVLNTLVLPGSGHVTLGHKTAGYLIGAIVMVPLFLCLIAFGSSYLHAAFSIRTDVNAISGITDALSVAYRQNASLIKWSVVITLLAWAIGIADIVIKLYRHGKKIETERL